MTKKEATKIANDHRNLGADIKVVEVEKDNFKVFANCSDGLVEIKPKYLDK